MSIDKNEAEAVFDDFLFAIDDQTEWLVDESEKHNIKLTNSPNTPEVLENLFNLLSAGMNENDTASLVVIFGRYLGEFMRLNYGGQWTLPLDDEHNVNFNTPVITGHSPIEGLEFAPMRIMRAYALRRSDGTLRRAIDNHINPQILDLSQEAAQEKNNKN
ncbi:hypothetical protein NTD80_00485 [Pseudomonas sp. 13B_2.1_Bac1]|uniref:hypothetical protein n=1 Tax=Pseudomonas sp. 13B_2.1_Bac1 TaxID=2971624 RepID=UPI0021C9123A|nr:hypothetical protein [Pseudomonas sp. 13B_2.1_Bac1]MCU1781214.1 hypothetical protein [Pseudomonas sp. 13B_2.1_Bac1]